MPDPFDEDALIELQRRIARTPPDELADADLLALLAARYATEEVPPCRVCGGRLSVASIGGGEATRYACSGQETDPENPERLRYKPGRTIADEHYANSRWTHYREGDAHVRELVQRFRRLTTPAA